LGTYDFPAPILRGLTQRASNDPQRMRARKIGGKIVEMMPMDVWLSRKAASRLIGARDERKTRARLDRLASEGKIERKRERSDHEPVILYRTRNRNVHQFDPTRPGAVENADPRP
jgi:hypothetical protein